MNLRHAFVAPCLALCLSRPAFAGCEARGIVEFWTNAKPRIAGLDVSWATCPAPYFEYRAGFSYFATKDYLYEGATGSFRLRAGDIVAPFVGVGVLAGIARRDQRADADGLDNDGDGVVDESGEEAEVSDVNAFVYPEVGLTFQPSWIGFTLAARKFYGREFDGKVIYSFGVSMLGGD